MSPQFQLQLDRERFRPGETVRGSVLVVEGGNSRSVEALLEYNEKVEDYLEVAVSVSSGTLYTGELVPGMSFEFELVLPDDACPNFKSEHGELYWELDAKSDEFGRDTHERRRIEVEPAPRTDPAA